MRRDPAPAGHPAARPDPGRERLGRAGRRDPDVPDRPRSLPPADAHRVAASPPAAASCRRRRESAARGWVRFASPARTDLPSPPARCPSPEPCAADGGVDGRPRGAARPLRPRPPVHLRPSPNFPPVAVPGLPDAAADADGGERANGACRQAVPHPARQRSATVPMWTSSDRPGFHHRTPQFRSLPQAEVGGAVAGGAGAPRSRRARGAAWHRSAAGRRQASLPQPGFRRFRPSAREPPRVAVAAAGGGADARAARRSVKPYFAGRVRPADLAACRLRSQRAPQSMDPCWPAHSADRRENSTSAAFPRTALLCATVA